jgi:hypothetical protein
LWVICLARYVESAEPPGASIYLVTQDLTSQPGKGNQVGLVDPSTGETKPQPLPITVDEAGNEIQMFDVAVDPKGKVWGIDSGHRLWIIDPERGVSVLKGESFAGAPPEPNFNGLTVHPETGELFFALNLPEEARFLYKLDVERDCNAKAACTLTTASPLLPAGSAGDVAFHYVGDTLYLFLAGDDALTYRLAEADGVWSVQAKSEEELTSYFTVKGLASSGAKLFAAGDIKNGDGVDHAIEEVDPKTLQAVPNTLVTIKGTGKLRVAGLGSDTMPPPGSKKGIEASK